jgi:hypothetical protein
MRWSILMAVLVAAGCGDNKGERQRDDAGIDASVDAGRLTGCLDTPRPVAPNGQLPCDLIPPGLTP